ncbi:hypothetical protein EDD29_0692 [Actinocorallia herbida]|uniref:Integral membrane protein n=1 Tax=Actinocorallia herbida TaxID=58109 RepID=A0A3N1CR65_9ACTN|nr:hypothetical protein [Actinocorallia herbida]ROO83198.1 hypothetical protein EDD29_0692 [Actinocorallia herbida]
MSQRPRALAAAAVLQSFTGLAALGFGLSIAFETLLGHRANLGTAVSVTVLTVGGGLAILWIAKGLWTAQRWSRSPAVLTQLFALPVSVSLIQSDQPWWGYPLITVAVLALLTLLSPPVTEAVYADDLAEAGQAAAETETAAGEPRVTRVEQKQGEQAEQVERKNRNKPKAV